MTSFVEHLSKRAPYMQWTEHQDLLLCREILAEAPYRHKPGTRERGHCWSKVSDTLNAMRDMNFNVSKRSVRDRYNLLEAKYARKISNEEKGTEVSQSEQTELDILLEEINRYMKEGDVKYGKETPDRRDREDWDNHCLDDARRASLDACLVSRKRKSDEMERVDHCEKTVIVSPESETLLYIRDKMEQEAAIRQQELELRRKELEMQSKVSQQQTEQQKLIVQGQTAIIQSLQQQLQQQQEQQQKQQQQLYQMQSSFLELQLKQAQMQQQLMAGMMSLIENLSKEKKTE